MSHIQEDTAVQIRQGEGVDLKALQIYLNETKAGFGEISSVMQFPGGYSNLTYLIRTDLNEYVLRRAPLGANIKSAHDMSREYKVLSLLAPFYKPAPKPIVFCENEAIIGVPFYLMQKVNGIILRGNKIKENSIDEATMHHISEKLVDNLVALHQIDIETSSLATLGKPDGYVDRQVEGWIGRYEKSKTDSLKNMDELAIWLNKNKPKFQKPAFIHNDYKYDNVVFDHDLKEIIAVLDWEMATVGDPLMDLGATLAYWCEASEGFFLKSMNITWHKGNLTRKQVVARYAEKTGRDVSDVLFYYVFGLYKNAVILQQIYARWKKGLTADARFEQLIIGVNELANLAVLSIQKNSI